MRKLVYGILAMFFVVTFTVAGVEISASRIAGIYKCYTECKKGNPADCVTRCPQYSPIQRYGGSLTSGKYECTRICEFAKRSRDRRCRIVCGHRLDI